MSQCVRRLCDGRHAVPFRTIYIVKKKYKSVGPPYCPADMYAGRVACCPLVSHGKYADGTDERTDGRQAVTLCFPLDAASAKMGS